MTSPRPHRQLDLSLALGFVAVVIAAAVTVVWPELRDADADPQTAGAQAEEQAPDRPSASTTSR